MEASEAILALLTGTAEQKEAAAWTALCETMQGLERIVPGGLTFPGILHGISRAQLADALTAEDKPAYAVAFGRWRGQVLALEARNAGRLNVLVGALERLRWLRARGFDAASLDRFEPALEAQLRRAWNLSPPGPEVRDTRAWCMAKAMRPDLLPYAWRSL